MAKGSPLMAKQSGKLGSTVLSTRYGEQIQRAYVKEIANPRTEAQTNTRSKFKLCSQLSAVMADVIAIPRQGSVTGRNQFVSETMKIAFNSGDDASVNLNGVQLTKSLRSLVGFEATRDASSNEISIALKSANPQTLDRVVYVAFEKDADGNLTQLASKVVDAAGVNNTFPTTLGTTNKSVVMYAYGIADKDGATSAKFGNLIAPSAEQVAKLIVSSSAVASGVNLTRTVGATMPAGTNSADSDDSESVIVSLSVSPAAAGSVRGGGSYALGESVSVVATPATGNTFKGWFVGELRVSAENPYAFIATRDVSLVAHFNGEPVETFELTSMTLTDGAQAYDLLTEGPGSELDGLSPVVDATYIPVGTENVRFQLYNRTDSASAGAWDGVNGEFSQQLSLTANKLYELRCYAGGSLKFTSQPFGQMD